MNQAQDEEGEVLTRGHKKKARTRKQLLNAAVRIYAQKGARELNLNELAQEAGVSNGTVYNYFRTKDDVLEAVAMALAEELSDEVARRSVAISSGAERVAIGVRSFILKAVQFPDWASALINVVRYAEGLRSKLGDYVRKDVRSGLEQTQLDYADEDLAVSLLISGVISTMIAIVEDRYKEGDDRLMATMLLQALGMNKSGAQAIANMDLPELSGTQEG